MKYKIKMILDGEFPGSPDIDNFIVNEDDWDKIRNIIYPKYLSENRI